METNQIDFKKVQPVMVYRPNNINKTNNHLSPQIIEHKKGHNISYGLEIQVLTWDEHKIVAGLKGLIYYTW